MTTSVLVLGAGFGGLELSTRLSHELGDQVDVTLIDRADAFVFGFSKLDVMFGKRDPDEVRLPYGELRTPRVRFRQETVTSIDPAAPGRDGPRRLRGGLPGGGAGRRLRLGRDARAGRGRPRVLLRGGRRGAARRAAGLPRGNAIVGVCGAPFKCPPAPSEAALLLDDFLRERGVRDDVTIQVVIPFGTPVPPSPATSEAILARFAERGIEFVPDHRVASLDPARRSGPGRRQAPAVRPVPGHPGASRARGRRGVGPGGGRWIPVDPRTLATLPGRLRGGRRDERRHAEGRRVRRGAARAVADQLIARLRDAGPSARLRRHRLVLHRVRRRQVARVDVDFYSTPGKPSGTSRAVAGDGRGEGGLRVDRRGPVVRRMISLSARDAAGRRGARRARPR